MFKRGVEVSSDKVVEVVYSALREINEQRSGNEQLALELSTSLLGEASGLDSLTMINLFAAIEDGVEDAFGVYVSVSSEETAGEAGQEWVDVGSLAAFLEARLKEL